MSITSDDVKTIVAVVASITSFIALWVSWWLWTETNRPIVTVELEADGGNVAVVYHLVVHNCGNRPATNIRLTALDAAKNAALVPTASVRAREQLQRCFAVEHQIQLLRHGESTKNALGAISTIVADNELVHRASIPITVEYEDLQGRSYKTSLTIIIKDSKAFAGSWYESNEKERA